MNTNGYTAISGYLYISGSDITDLTPLDCITSVGGFLYIYFNSALTNLNGLQNITSVGDYITINDNSALTNLNGLQNITSVGGYLNIFNNSALTNLDGLQNITSVGGYLYIGYNSALTNLNGLQNITSVDGYLYIGGNDALTNLDGLQNITSFGGYLYIGGNDALTNLDGLQNITSVGGYLYIGYNSALTNLDGLQSLTSVGGDYIYIFWNDNLVSFCGLYLLFSTGTFPAAMSIHHNGANPTASQIIAEGPCFIAVTLDIEPETCPDSLNVNRNGKIPVAILGTGDLDVNDINTETLELEGIAPIRLNTEDVATPVADGEQCDCTDDGPDGFDDLTLKFDAQEIIAVLGSVNDGDELVLTITGNMLDGTPIEGSDCVIIIDKNLHKELTGNLSGLPEEYALFGNYPNPFNPSTLISYQLPEASNVTIRVYDVLGKEVATLVNEEKPAGYYDVEFNAASLSSGIYFYIIQAGDFIETNKMVLMK